MAESEPAFLTVGTEVSAKFKGAFCEAKIKKVTKKIRCKVALKEHPFGTVVVENHQMKGDIYEVNHTVDVIQGKTTIKGVILTVKDLGSYDVVFNDGDEKTLRRTQLCLKGGRHFDEKVSLDSLPLYNPEQWINNPHLTKSVEIMPKDLVKKLKRRKAEENSPQKRKKRKEGEDSDDEGAKKREKRAAASAASVAIEEMDQGDTELSGDGTSSGDASDVEKEREKDRKKEMDRREKSVHKSPEEKNDKYTVGEVICYYEDPAVRTKWQPGVVVSRKIYKTTPKPAVLTKKDYPVRLFTNGRYYKATLKQLSLFEDQRLRKKALEAMNANMKVACERAQAFIDKEALPASWKRNEVFDEEEASTSKEKEPKDEKKKEAKKEDKDKKKEKEKDKKVESESSESEESEDEASAEERDLFVAQLYKFQEDRGTPINRAPVLGGRDIDLYRFYQVVQNYGGAKRVTANGEWKKVLIKLKLEGCPGATPVTVRKAYGRYLAHFNSFYKSLGAWTPSNSGNGTASPRDRRVLLRGPTEDKKKKKKTPGDKKKDSEDKESTVEKESSVESKDTGDKEKKKDTEKKEEKKPAEKAKEVKTEKIERDRTHSISEKDKKEEKEKAKEAVSKQKEEKEKKEPEKKKEEKKKTERKKEDSESTAEHSESGRAVSRAPSVTPKLLKKSESTNDEDEEEDDEYDLPFKGKRPRGYEDDAESTEWIQADIFINFYLGQKVRAWHHGKWYEARVVNFHQPGKLEMLEFLKKYENSTAASAPEECVRYLSKHIQDTRVFVHYLGWNSRYDENVSLAKLKCEAKDVETSLSFYRPGSPNGAFLNEPFLKKLLQFVRGSQGVGGLKREHTKGGGLGNGYRPRRITREKYEQILAAELSHKPKVELKREETISPAVSTPHPTTPQPLSAKEDTPEDSVESEVAEDEPQETEELEKEEVASPSDPRLTVTPSADSIASNNLPSSSPATPVEQPKEEPVKEKTPKEPTPVASPRAKRQRTVSTASNRTASPAVIVTPPPVPLAHLSRPSSGSVSPPKPPHHRRPPPSRSEDPPAEVSPSPSPESKKIVAAMTPYERAEYDELNFQRKRLAAAHEQQKKESAASAGKPKEPPVLMTLLERRRLMNGQPPKEPTPEEEEEEDEDDEEDDEEEEEYDEKEEVKEEPVKLREMPRRVTIMGKEPVRFQSPEQTPKRRRRESESVEEAKEEVEDEEDEEFDQLEEEAKNLMNVTRDDESDTGSGSATPQREEDDNETADDRTTPGMSSSGKTKKAVKRKRMFNSRHSQMVVDKKYIKHKPKASNQNEESEDEEEEESAFNKESYVKRKNNMYKQLEADNKLDDCSSIGMDCITQMAFPADQIIPNYEAHLLRLRSIYASARQEIHILERQRRAQEEKKREVRDRERHLKESMSSPSQSTSSSSATADST